eukprot:14798272-Alexandrium_andersonii.AAC.1
MSASLVGSEMCIRDSTCRPTRRTLRDAPPRRSVHVRRRVVGLLACAATVSYTHLTLPTICSV